MSMHHPRLVAYQRIIRSLSRSRNVWLDFLSRLPLTLGESDADRVVPLSFSDTIQAVFNDAVDGLADLIRRRHDPAYNNEKQSALLTDERMRVPLWPKRFCPRSLGEDSPLMAIVRLSLLQSPDLDGGLLESWLSRKGGGRLLYETVLGLMVKSFRAARAHPNFSGVALMTHLAVLNEAQNAKERIKQIEGPALAWGRFERAMGMALHALLRQASEAALAKAGASRSDPAEQVDQSIMIASVSPLPFFSVKDKELDADLNPYSLSTDLDQLLMPAYQAALEHSNEPGDLLESLQRAVMVDSPLRGVVLSHAQVEHFRRLTLDHLMAGEDQAFESDRMLAMVYSSNQALLELLTNNYTMTVIASDLQKRAADPRRMPCAHAANQRLLEGIMLFRDREANPGPAEQREATAVQELLERFLLHRMDEFASGHVNRARQRLVDRRGAMDISSLNREYEAGRLYRIAMDEQPLLRTRIVQNEAQLFVDLKGYTRRTAQAKELVMAEFMKNEFYEPILSAAKRYYGGATLVSSEENIQLVNLLGDAVAFSGNVVSLMGLARDIQHVFRNYQRKLQEFSPEDDQDALQQVRTRIAAERQQISQQVGMLQKELKEIQQQVFARSALDDKAKVDLLQQEYTQRFERLQADYKSLQAQRQQATDEALQIQFTARMDAVKNSHDRLKQVRQKVLVELKERTGDAMSRHLSDLLGRRLLEQIRATEDMIRALREKDNHLLDAMEEEERRRMGYGLEAGLFISHGAAAEVIELDDDVWGMLRVAISEHINEAARGTARNGAVKMRLDEALSQARQKSSRPGLVYPFRVFVAQTGEFGLDDSLQALYRKAVAEKDEQELEGFLEKLAESTRERFREVSRQQDSTRAPSCDIYNLGEALSAKTLDAYLDKTRATHFFFQVQVQREELHPEFSQLFFIPDKGIHLIVGRDMREGQGDAEIFRYVGQVLFRGFEISRPTPIYEMLRPSSPFVRLLDMHHMKAWTEEALENPSCKLESLSIE
ncbi:MAG: hypothetical protein JRF33_01995 [Deltaproteobacteria bacterium]|nr:hypothetical protein [Deltaproteobacteria bacterium]